MVAGEEGMEEARLGEGEEVAGEEVVAMAGVVGTVVVAMVEAVMEAGVMEVVARMVEAVVMEVVAVATAEGEVLATTVASLGTWHVTAPRMGMEDEEVVEVEVEVAAMVVAVGVTTVVRWAISRGTAPPRTKSSLCVFF